jgi:hypothetical protein
MVVAYLFDGVAVDVSHLLTLALAVHLLLR